MFRNFVSLQVTHDTYSTYPRGVHMKISFGGAIGWIEPYWLVTQVSVLTLSVSNLRNIVCMRALTSSYLVSHASRLRVSCVSVTCCARR